MSFSRRPFWTLTALATTILATSAYAASDAEFLTRAIQGDVSEIALGHLAEQKGGSDGMRAFGHMLVDDHTTARTEAIPVAQAHGLKPIETLQPEAVKERDKLASLSGPVFDLEFARYMVEDQKRNISDFEEQAANGDASTRALAEKILPDLREDLVAAEQLEGLLEEQTAIAARSLGSDRI